MGFPTKQDQKEAQNYFDDQNKIVEQNKRIANYLGARVDILNPHTDYALVKLNLRIGDYIFSDRLSNYGVFKTTPNVVSEEIKDKAIGNHFHPDYDLEHLLHILTVIEREGKATSIVFDPTSSEYIVKIGSVEEVRDLSRKQAIYRACLAYIYMV